MKKVILLALAIVALNSHGHSKESINLQSEISQMDAKLFDAFNNCNLTVMANIFSKDLEFYHDTGGVSNYEQTLAASKSNCDKNLGLTRTLVTGSSKVFPIKGFGAIQEAKHQFCHMENDKNDCGIFKFVHIWKKDGDTWKLARVISYDH